MGPKKSGTTGGASASAGAESKEKKGGTSVKVILIRIYFKLSRLKDKNAK